MPAKVRSTSIEIAPHTNKSNAIQSLFPFQGKANSWRHERTAFSNTQFLRLSICKPNFKWCLVILFQFWDSAFKSSSYFHLTVYRHRNSSLAFGVVVTLEQWTANQRFESQSLDLTRRVSRDPTRVWRVVQIFEYSNFIESKCRSLTTKPLAVYRPAFSVSNVRRQRELMLNTPLMILGNILCHRLAISSSLSKCSIEGQLQNDLRRSSEPGL